nr:hypothetical protein Iba_chr11aCG12850 [Ipomoea batatas]
MHSFSSIFNQTKSGTTGDEGKEIQKREALDKKHLKIDFQGLFLPLLGLPSSPTLDRIFSGINFSGICSSPFCSDYGRHSQPPSLDKNAFTKHVFRYVAIVLRTVIAIWSPQGVAPAHHHWGSR